MSVTIYDVAKQAGVSIATVSKVLSGRRYVSAATRERVLAAVAALNYVPNAVAQGLATNRSRMVGMVITFDPDDLFADPNLLQVLHGVDAEVAEHDNALLLSTARNADDRLSAYRRLLDIRRADGILIESGLGEEGISLLLEQGYPCVVIGYSELGLPCVHPDDYGGARQMATHLVDLGHRRIGIISGPPSNPPAMRARFQAFHDTLIERGVPWSDDLRVFGNFRRESGYEGAAALMALRPPPTAIFAFNDRMAMGAIHCLRERGYRVPGDISVAGFDDIASAANFDPPLTTVHFSPVEIGRRAAALLFACLEEHQNVCTEEVLPVELIVRCSTAPLSC